MRVVELTPETSLGNRLTIDFLVNEFQYCLCISWGERKEYLRYIEQLVNSSTSVSHGKNLLNGLAGSSIKANQTTCSQRVCSTTS